MKKLKAKALVAIFATAMFQPMDAETKKDRIAHVPPQNGCFNIVVETTILWGLIVTNSENLGEYCPDNGASGGFQTNLHAINFDNP